MKKFKIITFLPIIFMLFIAPTCYTGQEVVQLKNNFRDTIDSIIAMDSKKIDSLEILLKKTQKETEKILQNITTDDEKICLNPGFIKYKGVLFEVFIVDLKKDTLRFFLENPLTHKQFETFSAVKNYVSKNGDSLVFITNGGMYDADGYPVGLYIEQGKIYKELNIDTGYGNFYLKPNGVFYINSENKAGVLETSQFSKIKDSVIYATQSGPMLVINNQIHPVFRKNSHNKFIRSGVGVITPNIVVFAISEDVVNFYTFASLFRDYFFCKNALYLDGTISELYHSRLDGNNIPEGLFGVMIGVVKHKK